MSVYQKNELEEEETSRTLSLIVDNQPGTLARVIGLFSGRGYNIESLNVKGTGSGFLISNDGYIVTNHHVIAGATNISVYSPFFNKTDKAKLIGYSECDDLAVLKIDTIGDSNYHFKWSTDVLSAGSNFTMQVRLKTTNNNWHGSMPLYNTFGPSDRGFWHHFQANGTLGSTLGTMGTANSNDGVGLVQDQWQLTTLTYDGSAMKLYKNGTLQFTKQGALSWNLGNSGASAGKLNYRSSGTQYFFHGLISSQLIYNRALTQTEIENNYDLLNGSASTSTSSSTITLTCGS